MLNAIKALLIKHPSAGIDVTGHSLGASLATYAALAIKKNFDFSRFTFYTFGSPRTGNPAFSDYIFSYFPNGAYQRITHYNDIVPHLRPHVNGFQHASDETWYINPGTDMTHQTCTNSAGKSDEN